MLQSSDSLQTWMSSSHLRLNSGKMPFHLPWYSYTALRVGLTSLQQCFHGVSLPTCVHSLGVSFDSLRMYAFISCARLSDSHNLHSQLGCMLSYAPWLIMVMPYFSHKSTVICFKCCCSTHWLQTGSRIGIYFPYKCDVSANQTTKAKGNCSHCMASRQLHMAPEIIHALAKPSTT